MGTDSVGWAVTNDKYELMRGKGKDMWGSRLFDSANTSLERRTYRISRRRLQREKARLLYLNESFADEIEKIDSDFFLRMKESQYYKEDRSINNQQKNALFNDADYQDKDYFAQYPTIFHLRNELLHSTAPHDVRLVYLALADMFKNRGHFLNNSLGTEESSANFKQVYDNFVLMTEKFEGENNNFGFPKEIDYEKLEEKLGEKGVSRSKVVENVMEFFGITKKDKSKYELILLMCGRTGKLINIYGTEVMDDEHKGMSLCFRDSNYDEKESEVLDYIGDDYFELLNATKELHDIGLLANIMKALHV